MAKSMARVYLGDVIDLTLSSVDKKLQRQMSIAYQLCNYMDVYKNSFIHVDMDFTDRNGDCARD